MPDLSLVKEFPMTASLLGRLLDARPDVVGRIIDDVKESVTLPERIAKAATELLAEEEAEEVEAENS
jgi:hypothetical protein